MSKKHKRVFLLLAIVLGLGVTAFAFSFSRKGGLSSGYGKRRVLNQKPTTVVTSRGTYVRRSLLRSQLNLNLTALGDRLEKAGQERATLIGTLSRLGDPQPGTLVMIAEFPDRIRATIQNGAETRVITFDGQEVSAVGKPIATDERDLIETLVYDTAEHFFSSQTQGMATQFFGARFRMDDGSSKNYVGPYYDVYEVNEPVKTSSDQKPGTRLYYFNSDSLLLERVRYQINKGETPVEVETRISNWQKEHGQQIPHRIERIEGGKSVLVLTLNSVNFSAGANDGIFSVGPAK